MVCCRKTGGVPIVSPVSGLPEREVSEVQALLSLNLRRGRTRLGFSQARVAEECELTPNYISEIESGAKFPSAAVLSRIARVLGMRPAELFFEEQQWELRDRQDSIARFASELKTKLGDDIDDLVRRHMLE